ncbi:hypothetical protein HPB47_027761 [Ixodes persulcatus]|uniref:Uncharacterized protein n=1 Tax=Ixodes persulcatus TaxID=34615 RepID=A0AC60PV18_IXOPE|nr:hypothetical protein HPB47_027761 [Ixodes persulcatus]
MEGRQEERRQHQPQGEGTGASSIPKDGPSNDVPALVTRTPPRKKEGVFRFKASGEASTSKDVPVPAAPSAVQPEEERMELGELPPPRSVPPDDARLKKSSQKKLNPRVTPPKPPQGT